jgi:hypothetical protein
VRDAEEFFDGCSKLNKDTESIGAMFKEIYDGESGPVVDEKSEVAEASIANRRRAADI